MSIRTRRLLGLAVACAGLILMTLGPAARAQRRTTPKVIEVKGDEEKQPFTDAVTVPTNRESKRLIQAAQDYIKKKEWQVAAECLQSLLEDKQDSFIDVDGGPDDKGKATKRRVSVRTEANRLIGELPPDGLESYQVKYGQTAKDHLKIALDTNDPAMLAEVALRYLHTKAGADATNLLGTYYLDRGEYLMSALSFERLLTRPDADKLPTKVLFKAALAYRRTGDLLNADKVWKLMADKAGRGDLVFGTRKVTLDQARVEMERAATQMAQAGLSDWWLFRGNPARNAQGVGGTAYLEPLWHYKVAPVDEFAVDQQEKNQGNREIQKYVDAAILSLEGKPVLPAFYPISANGRLLIRTYDGIHAISLRGEESADGKKKPGERIWESPAEGGLYALINNAEKRLTLMQWADLYRNQGVGPVGVFFENSTIGTLAHDGKNVYFVDDLAVPPHPSSIQQPNFGNPVNYGKLSDEVQFSRLRAVEIEGGKLIWTIGAHSQRFGKDKDDAGKEVIAGLEFMDSYFLGPPLPLAGKLYCLVEKNTELRLICLNPARMVPYQDPNHEGVEDRCPELVWQQSLGTANVPVPRDSLRRMQAAHLAYADGILVCPTNAGVVVGVDLLSHSLVWAHSYRDGVQQPGQDDMMNLRRFGRGGIMQIYGGATLTQERWRPSAPIIQNGKVVFTAHDGGEMHCLNLRDGRLLWHVKREDDDLYLAGVFGTRVVVVGKGYARAVNLDDGKPLWKQPTGMPSGQGAASGDVYYLPLAWAADDADRKPAVLAINVATGKPIAPPAKSRKKEHLGNLIFVDGELVSQTALEVAAFPELKQMLADIDRRLKDNPTDPVGLTQRGELYLDKGDLKGAVGDLRTALANRPPPEVLGKAQNKLHEALTDLLKTDFPAGEKFLDEYHDLCKMPVPADADANTKQRLAEERLRREVNYLSLLGSGREQQGRLLDAFAAYEEFGTLTGNKELVSVVNEPNTKSRPDVWSRGRIKGMLDKASPEQRKLLDEAIEKKWAAIKSGSDLDAVRKFVSMFGTHSKVGREAQFQLAERLIAANGPDDLTEAETKLQALCFSPEVRRQDPTTAAKAIDAMIRVYLKRGLYEDAVGFYKQLGTDFANVPVRDGKTGAELLNELFTDKRFLPYLEPLGVQWKGAIRAKEEGRGQSPTNQTKLTVDPEGDNLLPFFRRHRIVMETSGAPQTWTLRLLDRATGDPEWEFPGLPAAQYFVNAPAPRFAHAAGHTLVLHLNHMIYAFNLAERKKLWEYSLYGKSAALASPNQNMRFDADGRMTVEYPDNRKEMLGGIGLVEASYVILVTRDGLVALDPARASSPASVLWTKSDVSMRAQLFGDDEHIYVVEPGSDASPPTVRALRAQDGVTVPVPDFARLFANRVRTDGRRLLLRDDDPQGGKAVRLYDVQTGQDVWRARFTAGALVVQSQDPDLTCVIEKDNTVTFLNFRTGAVLFKTLLLPEHAANLESAVLLGDHDRFYLALNRRAETGMHVFASANTGIRSLPVNGPVYALNRGTGKLDWVCDFVPHQMLLLEQYQELPILLFTSQYNKTANGYIQAKVKVTGVDKRTGKLIYDKEFTPGWQFVMRVDPHAGLIELARNDLRIQFRLEGAQAVRADAPDLAAPVYLPGQAVPIRR